MPEQPNAKRNSRKKFTKDIEWLGVNLNPVFKFFSTRPSPGDWIGGFSVALVLIPQAIAYATIAGLPPSAGLFAATLPLIVAAPLVSCPWLQTGPVALTSLFTAGALAYYSNSPEQICSVAATLAVIVGMTRLCLGLSRLGGYIKLLLTRPVVLGFTTAAAILIISSQLAKALGADNAEPNVLHRAFNAVVQIKWSLEAIGISIVTAAIALIGKRVHKLFPSVFMAVVLAIIYSKSTGYEGATVGQLSGGFVSLNLNYATQPLLPLLFSGIVIAVVGFAEPASISMTLMEEEELDWNPNQELCGGGLANVVSGLVGGYPVGGSFSRTSINRFAGSTSSWSGLITGTIVLCSLWLTPLLAPLPKAALGTIIIVAVIRLINVKEIWRVYQTNQIYGSVAVTTLIATLATAPRIDIGISIGAILGLVVARIEGSSNNEDHHHEDSTDDDPSSPTTAIEENNESNAENR